MEYRTGVVVPYQSSCDLVRFTLATFGLAYATNPAQWMVGLDSRLQYSVTFGSGIVTRHQVELSACRTEKGWNFETWVMPSHTIKSISPECTSC